MHEPQPQGWRALPAQRVFERTIFASRWPLAPFYLGLAIGLGVLMIKFAQGTLALLADGTAVVVTPLSLIDLSLLGNLLRMVMFAGYETAISTIHVPEGFMDVARVTNRELAWLVGIYMAFVVSGVLLALMDRVADRAGH